MYRLYAFINIFIEKGFSECCVPGVGLGLGLVKKF